MLIINNLVGKFLYFPFLLFFFFTIVLTASCQNNSETVSDSLQRCQQFLDKDDLEGASGCYSKAILAHPDEGMEISNAGQKAVFDKCYELKEKKNYSKSIVCFEGLIELSPNSANVRFNLAESYYEFNEQKIERSNITDSELLIRAEEAVKSGLEIKPDDLIAHLLFAEILQKNGKFREALEQYEYLTKSDPKSSIFWEGLGFVQFKLNLYKDTIISMQKAISLNHQNTVALYLLGRSFEETGNRKNAKKTYEALFKIDPKYDDVKQRIEALTEKAKSAIN